MRVFQKDAYIGIDFLEKKTEVIRLREPEESGEVFTFDIETANGSKSIVIESPNVIHVNAIQSELIAFRNAILSNTPTVVSEQDGYLALDIAHQILNKINQGGIVRSS
jgi:hypothetical protein